MSFTKPHKSVSPATLSRWVRDILSEAGVDTSVWGAHSGRAASAAHLSKIKNLSHLQMCKLGDWSTSSGIFKKFYLKYI